MDTIHAAVWVSDLDETIEFFEGVLGLAHQREFTSDGVENYYIGGPEIGEIQFKYDPSSDESVEPAGIDHLAIPVDDVDETFQRVLAATDSEVVMEPTDIDVADRRAAFVTGPDGYVVELVGRM